MQDPVAHELIRTANGWDGGEPDAALKQATARFLARARQDPSLPGRIAESLGSVEQGAAAWIAVTCGTAIERGTNPEVTGGAVMGLLLSWLPKLPRETGPTAEQAGLLRLFQFVCRSAVSHLARLPVLREGHGRDAALIEELDELSAHSHGAIWVREALLKHSATLLLIHPTSGAALRTRYTNVSNCFHLFSLLQTAIGTRLEGGQAPDPAIARVARGASDPPVSDQAWWHYGDPHSGRPGLESAIPGEGLTREIPVVDDVQVMLAWPRIVERGWDGSFLAPHLEAMPADAVVESELSADEVAAWMSRLGIAPAKRRWRWPWARRTT